MIKKAKDLKKGDIVHLHDEQVKVDEIVNYGYREETQILFWPNNPADFREAVLVDLYESFKVHNNIASPEGEKEEEEEEDEEGTEAFVKVIIKAYNIPSSVMVLRPKGKKQYQLVRNIIIYQSGGERKEIPPPKNHVYLCDGGHKYTVISQDAELCVHLEMTEKEIEEKVKLWQSK